MPDSRHHSPYTAGVLAAIHGWPVCPCAGWHYQRDWWAGYKDQRKVQQHTAARHRQPGRPRERKAA